MAHADLTSHTACLTTRQIEGLLNTGLGLAKDDRGKPLYIALKTFSDKLQLLEKLAQEYRLVQLTLADG